MVRGLSKSEISAANAHKTEKRTIGIGSRIDAMKGVLILKTTEKKWANPKPVAMNVVGKACGSVHNCRL